MRKTQRIFFSSCVAFQIVSKQNTNDTYAGRSLNGGDHHPVARRDR